MIFWPLVRSKTLVLANFRQLHSKTAGHPEYSYCPGVETTTGPLGQGITNAVGMAVAEKALAAQFNRPGHEIIDHNTYVFMGDGCLMEGISHEACSLAGTLGLGKLIAFWDDNGISIDGEVEGWFTDDTPARFESYGWQVIRGVDGHDAEQIIAAVEAAQANEEKPTLICCKTIIGFGSPNKQGKEDCHGAPLGDDEIALARKELNWPHAPFEIPAEIAEGWDAREAGSVLENLMVPLAYVGGVSGEKAKVQARQLLEDIGLADKAEAASSSLSQVELRKMELARAMAARPQLLISDEAMAGLSGSEVDDVLDILIKLNKQGITIIMIEHIMHAVMRFSERLVCLDAGQIICDGDPQSVVGNPQVQRAYLGD